MTEEMERSGRKRQAGYKRVEKNCYTLLCAVEAVRRKSRIIGFVVTYLSAFCENVISK